MQLLQVEVKFSRVHTMIQHINVAGVRIFTCRMRFSTAFGKLSVLRHWQEEKKQSIDDDSMLFFLSKVFHSQTVCVIMTLYFTRQNYSEPVSI